MAEFQFPCSKCHQSIQCDDQWSGHAIQCPICQAQITVPRPTAQKEDPLVPKPPSGGGAAKLSAGATSQARSSFSGAAVTRQLVKSQKKGNPVVKYATIAGVVVVLAAGGVVGFPYVKKWQEDWNAKRRAAEKNSDGGELGHLAEVNAVLDATDPSRPGGPRMPGQGRPDSSGPNRRNVPAPDAAAADGGAAPADAGTNAAPMVPAVWTLDIAKAQVPEGRANGSISRSNFVPDTVRLDRVGTAQVLRLVQGDVRSPDREFLIYLHPKAGEAITNYTLTIAQDVRTGAPQVMKRWKPNPRFAPQSKSFSTGYAMKLQLGPATETTVNGKIYLALPDPEQSVVAGTFQAALSQATPGAEQPVVTTPNAPTSPQDAAARAAFERRYGTRR
jgi:hypothetical protein